MSILEKLQNKGVRDWIDGLLIGVPVVSSIANVVGVLPDMPKYFYYATRPGCYISVAVGVFDLYWRYRYKYK